MPVKYGKFQLPTKIIKDDKDSSDTFCRFIAEAFERGFGHTLGNALRRILLTSIEAPAIVSVKIEGVPHEYMAIEGVVEDMTRIVLNLKGALLRRIPMDNEAESRRVRKVTSQIEVTPQMLEKSGGQYALTLKEFLGDCDYDLVNPDHVVMTITKPVSKRVDVKIAIGRGYVPSERQEIENIVNDEIVVDSVFTPVRLVNYFVENTRVGQDTDFDRLVLEVTTDGRITPQEALSFATQIGILHFNIFEELKFQEVSFDEEESENDSDRDALLAKLALKICEIELSVRSTNCLQQADVDTIAELVVMPESDMLKFRNFGKKSLNEIKDKLEQMNLHLGMDLSKYGITQENVKDIVEEYLTEKQGKEAQ